ncbi:hypothetical protein RHDC4_00882 [Rhodocyclaceae bacterium]|nr:hypothetical protein RHDC4_00882 [Rhodocyclaceae bacterium]
MKPMPTEAEVAAMQAKYGLSYHVNYAMHAQQMVGLEGKRVLEVGGSLPREFALQDLGASRWIALEHREYWDEVLSTGNVTGTPPEMDAAGKGGAARADDYQVQFGSIEKLPDNLAGAFDVVFSIAAFEHIARLPESLEQMHRALVPGGKLFSLFAPIWSSHSGHHMPDITDQSGTVWTVNNSPVPPWGHLLYRPMELYDLLRQRMDAQTARELVYFVYGSPHINRLFLEDYVDIVSRSSFTVRIMAPQWAYPVPGHLQAQLAAMLPKRSDFSSCGLLLVLERTR